MIITYFGKQFFKIQKGDLTLAFNPISKDSKNAKVSRFGADIAFSTINHPDYNGLDMLSHGDTFPFEVKSPGDYEIKDIFIKGIMTNIEIDNKKYINTIYSLSLENIYICFLGSISGNKLGGDIRGQIDPPDILFVSINSAITSPGDAYKLAVALEPKVIIPMDYDDKSLKAFLKEGGQEKVASQDKLTIKSKELVGREGEIIVLTS
ncbi:TPA: MBL fold hydrolase [Candidatus Nomurabacteria bacterium]|nr:MAG: Zn-dependent hydrolase of the metallo-beta-lactamase superfamily [Parcubacteria bacterium RAAC4_OD1_1]HCY26450.1 MBL fold hydrolase [Candidatus Nomurabacteria bacterium]